MGTRPPLRGSWVLRQAGTVVGAIFTMAGAGLAWSQGTKDISPFHLSLKWLYAGGAGNNADPVKSIGMVVLVLVGLIVFGLVTPGRGTTIFAGVAAIAVALAFTFSVARTVGRSDRELFEVIGVGVYLTIAGGAIAIVGTVLGAGPHRRHH